MDKKLAIIVIDMDDVFPPVVCRGDTIEEIDEQLANLKYLRAYLVGLCFECSGGESQATRLTRLGSSRPLTSIAHDWLNQHWGYRHYFEEPYTNVTPIS